MKLKERTVHETYKTCLFGASPGTGNQGVNALCWSTLAGLAERGCENLHVFDYGQGTGPATFGAVRYTRHGMTIGKRIWRSNHLGAARLAASLGIRHRGLLDAVADADLVLDVSGGDSFTDLYGNARFRNIVATKQIALELGRSLVLLPQTYGPFQSQASRDTARRLICQTSLAFARDPDSFSRLQDLLGDEFDPGRHRLGVDLAFGLPAREPGSLDPAIEATLQASGQSPVIGLNVSGLLANQQRQAASRFSLACDYRSLMRRLVQRLLDETPAQILLVPHVHAPQGHYESDLDASLALLESLPQSYAAAVRERIAVVNEPLDACELKWLISRCSWFCGTRMHATIAAISSGVPTAALAYSLKTRGVFKTCDAADSVVDLREQQEEQVLETLLRLWRSRAKSESSLSRSLPVVRALASRQLDDIVDCVRVDSYIPKAVRC